MRHGQKTIHRENNIHMLCGPRAACQASVAQVVFFGPSVAADRPGLPHPSLLCLSTGEPEDRSILDLQKCSSSSWGTPECCAVQAMLGGRVRYGDKSWQRQQPVSRCLALHLALSATGWASQQQTAPSAPLGLISRSCEALASNLAFTKVSVAQVDVHVMDLPSLQDGKNETWREQDVAQVVADYLRHHPASTVHPCPSTMCTSQASCGDGPRHDVIMQVMTFDEEGVTQHPNHMATFRGVR